MDQALAAVAEQLVGAHPEVQCGTVIRVLTECADDFPDCDSHFVMQAASARLALLTAERWGREPLRDALDVSLHDDDLHEEVDLTTSLMVAANESEHPLAQRAVDEILGVVPRQRRPHGAVGHRVPGLSLGAPPQVAY